MTKFDIVWSVVERTAGDSYDEDDGIVNGDEKIVAEGKITKEAHTASELHEGLTEALERGFPRHQMGPTWEKYRNYIIDIKEAA